MKSGKESVYQDLLQRVRSKFEANSDKTIALSFLETMEDYLVTDAELTDPIWGLWKQSDMEVAGFDFDNTRKVMTIIACEFVNSDTVETLVSEIISDKFSRLVSFFSASNNPQEPLHRAMGETDPAFEISRRIQEKIESTEKIVFLLLTNSLAEEYTPPMESPCDKDCSFITVDISRIAKIYVSEDTFTETEINFENLLESGLPGLKCLEATTDDMDYKSYLIVMPGWVLAKLFDRYGQKLLEQNVRTFLQSNRKVNKGMLRTIDEAPERFFSYNNGLTCTASATVFNSINGVTYLSKVTGLQIVNGGQTASVIYEAQHNRKSLQKIAVQMKLSVIEDKTQFADFVGKVTRYANTQNPVKESDFFSNHPFHKIFKQLSKCTWTPPTGGRTGGSLWYYERTRGEYLNDQLFLEGNEKAEFLQKYPKSQMIDKIALAKAYMIFADEPYAASNAQKAFVRFADTIGKVIENDPLSINEKFYKDSIAKVILSKETDAIIKTESWYETARSVKSELKAFALGLLNSGIKSAGHFLNFDSVWKKQGISESYRKAVQISLNIVHAYMVSNHPPADWREHFRKGVLWNTIKSLDVAISPDDFSEITTDRAVIISENREAKQLAKMDNEIEDMSLVVQISSHHWKVIYDFFTRNRSLAGVTGYDVLTSKVNGRIKFPSEKQAGILAKLYRLAQQSDVKLE